MEETTPQPAGQPFTFPGVARYASARFGRLLAAALLFAVLPAAVIVWLAAHGWWPVLTEAAAGWPEQAGWQDGTLMWPERTGRLLGAGPFLSVQVNLGETHGERAPVDLAVELRRHEMVISGLLGDAVLPYPRSLAVMLERQTLVPFWGAWKVPLLGGVALAAAAGLITSWFALALVYAPLARLAAAAAGREAGFGPVWKLSVAAQWPASLLMTFALALYAAGEAGILFVLVMFVAHFLPSLLNVVIAPLFLPRIAERDNPFGRGTKPRRPGRNPFASPGTGAD